MYNGEHLCTGQLLATGHGCECCEMFQPEKNRLFNREELPIYHGARPVHLIITMIKWIRTSRLSIKNSLSLCTGQLLATGHGWECWEMLQPEKNRLFNLPSSLPMFQ